jgi:hypothetical protein
MTKPFFIVDYKTPNGGAIFLRPSSSRDSDASRRRRDWNHPLERLSSHRDTVCQLVAQSLLRERVTFRFDEPSSFIT